MRRRFKVCECDDVQNETISWKWRFLRYLRIIILKTPAYFTMAYLQGKSHVKNFIKISFYSGSEGGT
ncbi:hypothetical protein MIDIC_560009 [Alphaproteobacteria bacterium]